MSTLRLGDMQVHVRAFTENDLVTTREANGLIVGSQITKKPSRLSKGSANSCWKRSRQASGVGRRVGSTPSISRCSGVE